MIRELAGTCSSILAHIYYCTYLTSTLPEPCKALTMTVAMCDVNMDANMNMSHCGIYELLDL